MYGDGVRVQGMVTVYVCILAPIEPSSRPRIGGEGEDKLGGGKDKFNKVRVRASERDLKWIR